MSADRHRTHWRLSRGDCSGWKGPFSPNKPFVLLGQPSLFDSSRASSGRHTAWAYCHVPNGSTEDYTESIERQIVRFAPDFRDCSLSRSVSTPKDLERWNSNLVGGDILGEQRECPASCCVSSYTVIVSHLAFGTLSLREHQRPQVAAFMECVWISQAAKMALQDLNI